MTTEQLASVARLKRTHIYYQALGSADGLSRPWKTDAGMAVLHLLRLQKKRHTRSPEWSLSVGLRGKHKGQTQSQQFDHRPTLVEALAFLEGAEAALVLSVS